jgi:inositol 1,4,5-triphosphate receptor type 1
LSGIIIDTFAVLREEDAKKKDDMENFCFICGIEKDVFDKKGENKKGFLYHV